MARAKVVDSNYHLLGVVGVVQSPTSAALEVSSGLKFATLLLLINKEQRGDVFVCD